MKNIILLTAKPRTGKTRLIKRIIEIKGEENVCGFFAEEVRPNPEADRVGFRIREMSGKNFLLSHINPNELLNKNTKHKIIGSTNTYYVDIKAFDDFVTDFFSRLKQDKFLVFDEIGPMQVMSSVFRKEITELLNSPISVLSTIYAGSHEWLDEFKLSDKIYIQDITPKTEKVYSLSDVEIDELAVKIIDQLDNISQHFVNIKDELNSKKNKSENYVDLISAAPKTEKYDNVTIEISSEHGRRRLIDNSILGISCTCDFYKKANTCSHIMALQKSKTKIPENASNSKNKNKKQNSN